MREVLREHPGVLVKYNEEYRNAECNTLTKRMGLSPLKPKFHHKAGITALFNRFKQSDLYCPRYMWTIDDIFFGTRDIALMMVDKGWATMTILGSDTFEVSLTEEGALASKKLDFLVGNRITR